MFQVPDGLRGQDLILYQKRSFINSIAYSQGVAEEVRLQAELNRGVEAQARLADAESRRELIRMMSETNIQGDATTTAPPVATLATPPVAASSTIPPAVAPPVTAPMGTAFAPPPNTATATPSTGTSIPAPGPSTNAPSYTFQAPSLNDKNTVAPVALATDSNVDAGADTDAFRLDRWSFSDQATFDSLLSVWIRELEALYVRNDVNSFKLLTLRFIAFMHVTCKASNGELRMDVLLQSSQMLNKLEDINNLMSGWWSFENNWVTLAQAYLDKFAKNMRVNLRLVMEVDGTQQVQVVEALILEKESNCLGAYMVRYTCPRTQDYKTKNTSIERIEPIDVANFMN